MEFNEDTLITLLRDKEVEVHPGTFLQCAEEINIKLYNKGEYSIIEFFAPFPYIYVRDIGAKKLLNLLKPRLEYIKLSKDSRVIKLSSLPETEIAR